MTRLNHNSANLFRTLCHCALWAGLINSASAADKVYPKGDVPASGKIQSISPTKVVIEVRGNNQTYDLADVQKIAFDGEPTGVERARDHVINGQFDQALEEIKKVDSASVSSPAIQQEVQFYRWYSEGKLALGGNGDTAAAIQGLRELASSNRNTHHLVDMFAILGELYLSQGKTKEAAQYFTFLTRAPSPTTKAKGTYRLAQVELSQDNTEAAEKRFSQLVSASSSGPEMAKLQDLAKVGLAICKQRSGNPQDALKDLDRLIDKNDSTNYELFAAINNAKGACYEAIGEPTDALLAYLQTDLLFFSNAEAHAEALYHLKSLWAEYGNPTKAADAQKRLSTQYAGSQWANK